MEQPRELQNNRRDQDMLIRRYAERIEILQDKLDTTRQNNAVLFRDVQNLKQSINDLSLRYHDILNSKAWKITAPLRFLSGALRSGKNEETPTNTANDELAAFEQATEDQPLVSVIVPCYNHEQYLVRRLDSIYRQSYRPIEVILLDDASSDSSRRILSEYAAKYPEITRVAFNEKNSGAVFSQWLKGLSMANGPVVWIAESDDGCSDNFLEELIPFFKYPSTMAAFARSEFVTNGQRVWSTEEYLEGVKGVDWNRPFRMTAAQLVELGFARKNLIPNVSSALLRHPGELSGEILQLLSQTRLVHDWLFYLYLIKGGTVAYSAHAVNYYEIHENSTSLSVQKTENYYAEQEIVSKYIARNYRVNFSVFQSVKKDLLAHYKDHHHADGAKVIERNYRLDEIREAAKQRTPNIGMCLFSLEVGGGEIVPVHAANELRRQGAAVTLLNFNLAGYQEELRAMIRSDLPFFTFSTLTDAWRVAEMFGFEVLHSHHASVDSIAAEFINSAYVNCKSVISLHGMYETLDDTDADRVITQLKSSCSKFIYLTDANIQPFIDRGYPKSKFIKMTNGLPVKDAEPASREELGIGEKEFAVSFAARGIPEKGWREAAEIVNLASRKLKRPVHLIMVGDGETLIPQELRRSNIHLVGRQPDVTPYLKASDLLLFPSRFPGESAPLVVIEALQCGIPVLASDVGVINEMIRDETGNMAGRLFPLQDGKVPVEKAAETLLSLISDKAGYRRLLDTAQRAAQKFDISRIAQEYLRVYGEAIHEPL